MNTGYSPEMITAMKSKTSEKFIENCRYLGLKRTLAQYESDIDKAHKGNIGFYEFLEGLIRDEADQRRERSIRYRLKNSRLPQPYNLLQDFDFDFQPKLKKKLIMDLSLMDFIRRKESILFVGDVGTGKSHLARSLAMKGCEKGFKVFYTTCAEMINDLNIGVYEKTLLKRMQKYINPELLVIDEMGHDRLELEVTREAHLLFKVIDERYKQRKSLIFTSNVEEPDWADYLGDPITTKAILDRIFHHSIVVRIKGPSYREYQGKQLQKKYEQEAQTTD
jgi:DNA replication protein DnaC